ncbi:MAG: 16S rRNA (uracil(1498)-N(3))-methyltransferase [Tannerellaceae bacterium]|nr:16S rRNA (uracil(1498)-N(3))-methyltransferase [Tannerellaceae bacterium]
MPIFFAPHIALNPELPEEEARHALRVLRLGEGAEVLLADGKGFFYKAVLRSTNPAHCQVTITERYATAPLWNFRLHIAVAPTKNIDRMEWFCEKATEVGIDAITFLKCRFSERSEVNTSRLEKILISAMKQSGKATLPSLGRGMTDFSAFVRQPFDGHKFIAHCREKENLLLARACSPGENTLILIGPEGDFSPEEIDEACGQGFRAVSLGQSRLRTETAAFAACHTVHVANDIVWQNRKN